MSERKVKFLWILDPENTMTIQGIMAPIQRNGNFNEIWIWAISRYSNCSLLSKGLSCLFNLYPVKKKFHHMLKCFSKLYIHNLFWKLIRNISNSMDMVQHFSIFQCSHSSTATKCSLCLLLKINESCGSFINSQNLIALQCLSLQSKAFLEASWTVAVTNHSSQQWGIIQN